MKQADLLHFGEKLLIPRIAQKKFFFLSKLRIFFLTKWHKDMKIFMFYHRTPWFWTTGNIERPRVLYGATNPCATDICLM